MDDEQEPRVFAHSGAGGGGRVVVCRGKLRSPWACRGGEWRVEGRGWFRDVLGPIPSGDRVLAGSREEIQD